VGNVRNLWRQNRRVLTRKEVDALVAKSVEIIIETAPPDEIMLVGSATTTEFDDGSDLDFVLIYPTKDLAKFAERKLYAQTPKFPVGVDLICVDRATYLKRSQIGGIFFVCRESGVKIPF
jgi:hypothetical protein